MGDAPNQPKPQASTPARRASADEIREQQAIAAAMMIGEQYRHEDRKQTYWLAKRIGIMASVVSFVGLLVLFAYSQVKQEYNPTILMLIIGAIGAVGAVVAYWAYAEARRGDRH